MKKYHGSSEDTGAFLSKAVEIDGLVYLSGQVHADAELNLHGETIEEKFLYTMARIEENLAVADLTKDDIVRLQIYIVDIAELPALNAEYAKYFTHPMPVRTAIGVSSLPLNASLEIDVTAHENNMSQEIKPIASKEETFDKLEIRLGRIISVAIASDTPNPAYLVKVDFGKFGVKQTVGRFTQHSEEELKDKMVMGVLNFDPREIGTTVSEFLLLGVQYPKADSGEATPITPLVETKIGGKLF